MHKFKTQKQKIVFIPNQRKKKAQVKARIEENENKNLEKSINDNKLKDRKNDKAFIWIDRQEKLQSTGIEEDIRDLVVVDIHSLVKRMIKYNNIPLGKF